MPAKTKDWLANLLAQDFNAYRGVSGQSAKLTTWSW